MTSNDIQPRHTATRGSTTATGIARYIKISFLLQRVFFFRSRPAKPDELTGVQTTIYNVKCCKGMLEEIDLQLGLLILSNRYTSMS